MDLKDARAQIAKWDAERALIPITEAIRRSNFALAVDEHCRNHFDEVVEALKTILHEYPEDSPLAVVKWARKRLKEAEEVSGI